MQATLASIDAAIDDFGRARAAVSKRKTKQVSGGELRSRLKATAYAWFNTHRKLIASASPALDLSDVDRHCHCVLDATTRQAARGTYLDALAEAKRALVDVRSARLAAPDTAAVALTNDAPPDFAPLAANAEMREILVRRWSECAKCVLADAHLAAIVMMGGLLEALFVARANHLTNKNVLVRAASAPKDRKTGKALNYQEWTLDAYIKVGHELTWITESARDVADVLKEYRNFIHPEKEYRHGIRLGLNDSAMFWEVTKALARQLLLSTTNP